MGSVPLNMGVKAYNLGFAPRVGIAYQVMERTVVRAGYGRSFTPAGLGAVFGQAPDYDPPITNPQQLVAPNNYSPVFSLLAGPPLPVNPPIGTSGRYPLPNGLNTYYFFNPPSAYRIPLADSWNLTVQHQFTPTLTAEVGYVGNVGTSSVRQSQRKPGRARSQLCGGRHLQRLQRAAAFLSEVRLDSGYLRDLQLRQFELSRFAGQGSKARQPWLGFSRDLYLREGDGQ